MKSKESLESFTEYCEAHPEERFWQALRNWSKYIMIFGEKYDKGVDDNILEDTFYKE